MHRNYRTARTINLGPPMLAMIAAFIAVAALLP